MIYKDFFDWLKNGQFNGTPISSSLQDISTNFSTELSTGSVD